MLNIVLHIHDMMARLNSVAQAIIDALLSGTRWAVLVVPILLTIAHPARAADNFVVTETIEDSYSDVEEQPLLAPQSPHTARFGPFRLTSADRVEMEGGVETDTPSQFKALLSAHPGVHQIDMIDCPGSEDDDANLVLARMIRAAGLTMHVPSNGSIRSGAVELFLAGSKHIADSGAEIGVHSWRDSDGLEATDYPASDPVHAPYLAFYRDMGMSPDTARSFYDFTNRSASFEDLHIMSEAEMKRYGLIGG